MSSAKQTNATMLVQYCPPSTTPFVQHRPNVGPKLYKCYTNVCVYWDAGATLNHRWPWWERIHRRRQHLKRREIPRIPMQNRLEHKKSNQFETFCVGLRVGVFYVLAFALVCFGYLLFVLAFALVCFGYWLFVFAFALVCFGYYFLCWPSRWCVSAIYFFCWPSHCCVSAIYFLGWPSRWCVLDFYFLCWPSRWHVLAIYFLC